MPQFGGMHVAFPLGSHYSSWVSRGHSLAFHLSITAQSLSKCD